jgi:hypothetical protein
MYNIVENRYVLKGGSYLADLKSVDFITWRQDAETGHYRMKMHIGPKEVRFVCDTEEELEVVLSDWTTMQGKQVKIENVSDNNEYKQ